MKLKKIITISILFLAVLMAGCSGSDDNGKKTVITSLYPQYDFVKNIVGDKMNVKMLLKPGQDVHGFDPSTQAILDIKKADMFVYTGPELEIWADEIVEALDQTKIKVVNTSNNVELKELEHLHNHEHTHEEEEHHHGEHDPHVWLSLKNAVIMVDNILDALKEIDSENSEFYEENATAYKEELNTLEASYSEFLSAHEHETIYFATPFAFLYLMSDYHLHYESVYDTCSVEVEPSLEKITEMINKIKENDVKYIYKKELINDAVAQKIALETGAEVLLLHSASNVTKEEFDSNLSYIDIMKNNLEAIKKGFE